ncbi:hypothetical protein ACTXT7_011584 [Hymenolepis weldensis]
MDGRKIVKSKLPMFNKRESVCSPAIRPDAKLMILIGCSSVNYRRGTIQLSHRIYIREVFQQRGFSSPSTDAFLFEEKPSSSFLPSPEQPVVL